MSGAGTNNNARDDFTVTPWEVNGVIDYDKLIRQFGTQSITKELRDDFSKLAGERSYLLDREIYYSHRDLDQVLQDYRQGKSFFVYTGRGPSGPMHIGHMMQFYFTSWLQKVFDVNVYIQLTDDEKFLETKRGLDLAQTKQWGEQNILDIIAAGFDPDKTFIFLDTEYIGHMYRTALEVARKITFSATKAIFGHTNETNIGFIFYPSIQIVPSLFEHSRCLIPCGIDQDPFWRLQRDVASSLGYPKAAVMHAKLLPALMGVQNKMSTSSPETAIFLDDDLKTIRKKIQKYAFSGGQPSIQDHRRLGGNTDIDVPFQWLYTFFEPDNNRIQELKENYRSGSLLSGEMKEILIEKVAQFLEGHRERRQSLEDQVHLFKRDGLLASRMWRGEWS